MRQRLRWVASAAAIPAVVVVAGALLAQSATPTSALPESPSTVLDAHDCWTGDWWDGGLPKGEEPGHVVVTLRDHATATYGGHELVQKAMSYQYAGDPYNIVAVHGWCD